METTSFFTLVFATGPDVCCRVSTWQEFFFSEAETKVVNYSPKLDTLMENLRDRALLRVQSNIQDVQHGMR